MIYPIIFRSLQPEIGFPWTTSIITFIALSTIAVSIAVMKPWLPPRTKVRAVPDLNAFRSLLVVLFSIGIFLSFAGLYIPIFYIVVYAQRHGCVLTNPFFYLLSILNAASVVARIIPGLLADKFGSLNMVIACTIAAVFAYAWIAIHTLAGLVVFVIIYGFLSGAVVSLPATGAASFVPEMRLMGTWIDTSFCFAAMGILIDSLIADNIIDIAEERFFPD